MLLRRRNTRILMTRVAENDALRDDADAAGRRLHIKKQSVSQCVKPPPPPADNAASPRLADTAERDYFTLRERG